MLLTLISPQVGAAGEERKARRATRRRRSRDEKPEGPGTLYKDMGKSMFGLLDRDDNGWLDKTEVSFMAQQLMGHVGDAGAADPEAGAHIFRALDKNNDGKVSREEADDVLKMAGQMKDIMPSNLGTVEL